MFNLPVCLTDTHIVRLEGADKDSQRSVKGNILWGKRRLTDNNESSETTTWKWCKPLGTKCVCEFHLNNLFSYDRQWQSQQWRESCHEDERIEDWLLRRRHSKMAGGRKGDLKKNTKWWDRSLFSEPETPRLALWQRQHDLDSQEGKRERQRDTYGETDGAKEKIRRDRWR